MRKSGPRKTELCLCSVLVQKPRVIVRVLANSMYFVYLIIKAPYAHCRTLEKREMHKEMPISYHENLRIHEITKCRGSSIYQVLVRHTQLCHVEGEPAL